MRPRQTLELESCDIRTEIDFSFSHSIDRDKTAGNADCNNITEDMR